MIVFKYDNMLVDSYQPRINGNPIWNPNFEAVMIVCSSDKHVGRFVPTQDRDSISMESEY